MFERAYLKKYWFKLKFFFVLYSPVIEEDYKLYKITLPLLEAEQQWKILHKREKIFIYRPGGTP